MSLVDAIPSYKSTDVPDVYCPEGSDLVDYVCNSSVHPFRMVLDRSKIYHEPSQLSRPVISHLHYCVTQVQKKHPTDRKFRTRFTGGRDIWVETFEMLGRPSPVKNQDRRTFFRFNCNSFIVKSHFTFGIQKVEARHKHLIQLTKNGLLCYVCKGTGPLESDGLPRDAKTEDRVFPYHQRSYYRQFKFLPERKYIIPERTQYLLLAPTWVCFSFHRVSEDFSPPFRCIELQSLIDEEREMPPPPPPAYDPSTIQPATPVWDRTVSHVRPPDAEHLEPPPSKRQRTLDGGEVVSQTLPTTDSSSSSSSSSAAATNLESATTSRNEEPLAAEILAQNFPSADPSFAADDLESTTASRDAEPLAAEILAQSSPSADSSFAADLESATTSPVRDILAQGFIESVLGGPVSTPSSPLQTFPAAPSSSLQTFVAPSPVQTTFPAPSSSFQTFPTPSFHTAFPVPSSPFQTTFPVPSSPFQTTFPVPSSPVQTFVAPSPVQSVMAPHLLSPFVQNLSTPFPPPPPPSIYNAFHNIPTPLAPIFNNSNFQTLNPFGMPFNNSYQGQLPCSQILNYAQPYRYATCHCQQTMNVPPPQNFIPPQINYCETRQQIQEFSDSSLISTATATAAASSSSSTIRILSDMDQSLLDMFK